MQEQTPGKNTEVVVVIGAGGIGMAIARRQGFGRHILLADFNETLLATAAKELEVASYNVSSRKVDVSSRDSVRALADEAASLGSVMQVINTAGVSPNMAPPDRILAVDLYGSAVIFEEFERVIAPGGAGLIVSSMAGHMSSPLPPEQERDLAFAPADGVRNVLQALGFRTVRRALMTSIGVTNRTGDYNRTTEAHDWKRRSERLVRASGMPYTIVRPGWFDYNARDQHRLVLLQGDRRQAGDSSDGVVARHQIVQVLVHSLNSSEALRKTFELIASKGPAQEDFDAVFAPLEADPQDTLDGCMTWRTWRWRRNRSAYATISMLCAPATLQAPTASQGCLKPIEWALCKKTQTNEPKQGV